MRDGWDSLCLPFFAGSRSSQLLANREYYFPLGILFPLGNTISPFALFPPNQTLAMDHNQYAQLKQTYSQMSDDELAYLLATRGGHLTEEAQSALTSVLRSRNPDAVEQLSVSAAQFQAQESRIRKDEADKQAVFQIMKLVKLVALGGVLVFVGLSQLFGEGKVEWWLLLIGVAVLLWAGHTIFKGGPRERPSSLPVRPDIGP